MQMHWGLWELSQEALYCSFSLSCELIIGWCILHHSFSMLLASEQKPDTSSIPSTATTPITFRHSSIAWSNPIPIYTGLIPVYHRQVWVIMILWSARVYHHPTYHHHSRICYLHSHWEYTFQGHFTTNSLSLSSSKSRLWDKALDTRNLFCKGFQEAWESMEDERGRRKSNQIGLNWINKYE